MEKEKNNTGLIILIIILIIVILGLAGYIAYEKYQKIIEANCEGLDCTAEKETGTKEVEETKKVENTNIFEDFEGTYIHTKHSDACGDFTLTLELTKEGKATLDIKDECSGDKNTSGTYTFGPYQINITFDKPLQGEVAVDYTKFSYSYKDSKPIIYFDNEKIAKQ